MHGRYSPLHSFYSHAYHLYELCSIHTWHGCVSLGFSPFVSDCPNCVADPTSCLFFVCLFVCLCLFSSILILVWQRRGQTRSAVGDVSGAISDLNKALELDPQDVDTYCQRGGYMWNGCMRE